MEGHSLCPVLGVGVPAGPWVAASEPPPRLPEQAAAFQLCFAAWKCLRTAALRLYPPILARAEEHWADRGDCLATSRNSAQKNEDFSPEKLHFSSLQPAKREKLLNHYTCKEMETRKSTLFSP